MKSTVTPPKVTRRRALAASAAMAVANWVPVPGPAQLQKARDATVRDRLWLFACPTNSDYPALGQRSVMSPAEGTYYLDVPNLIIVQASAEEARYGRFEPPFAQYAIALRPLKRVVWSVVGSGGFTTEAERREGIQLAIQTPNFVGVMLDDFFTDQKEGKRAVLTIEELADIRQQLKDSGKKLDIFVTLYTRHLDHPLEDYLRLIDVVTMWAWEPAELTNIESNLKKMERLAPHARKMLGCYLVDYTAKRSTPVSAMKLQCETGLGLLQQKRIEGMNFLGNTTMDLDFEAVEWTREWIKRVGETEL